MCAKHIRVAVSAALSCSEQKPSLRQRHRLRASNAESRIRLIVLLTAPKIFAISSRTDKNSCRSFARLSAWCLDRVGLPHPKRKLIRSVLINGLCLFGVSVRKANAKISAEQDGCTRMRGTVLRKPPRRRSGIIRGRYFSMRVPTSPLRAMCS